MANKEVQLVAMGCVTCLFVIIVCIVQFGTMNVIELNYVGIQQSSMSKQIIEDQVFLEGRYMTGMFQSFIMYPTTWQSINFSNEVLADSRPVTSKTSDPSNIDISIYLMYKIKPESILQLWKNYPTKNHNKDMILTAKDLISKVVNQYSSDNFFKQRDLITYAMAKRISDVFRSKFYCELMFFQLNEVFLENSFEQSLIEQQVNKRESITAEKQQQIQIIDGAISVIGSQADIKITKIIQEGNVEAKKIRSSLEAQGEALVLKAYSDGYSPYMLSTGLNFTDSELIKYIFYEEMRQMNMGTITTGFDIDKSIFTA